MATIVKQKRKLKINTERTCDCESNHTNCLTAKEWTKSQVAVWEFAYKKRDIRDKKIHPAVFPIDLPAKCISLFSHQGELILDPFVGIGSTMVAAQDLKRNAIGFDLKKEYLDYAKTRLSQDKSTKQILVNDEAHNIPKYIQEESLALTVTSPPYSNILNRPRKNKSRRGNLRKNEQYDKVEQYSNDPLDLGTMEAKPYAEAIGEIYKGILPLLRPKAHAIINLTDLWWENKRIPIHVYTIEAMQDVGYELRNIIIWDRRNLVNGVGIFGWPNNYITFGTTFEYILDFWRPPK